MHEWEAIHRAQSLGRWPAEHLVRFATPRAPLLVGGGKPPDLVVELGCGSGAQLRLLLELGFEVVGLDVSPTAIEKAKSFLVESSGGRLNLMVVDLTAGLPFDDESVDGIVDVECLMCFPWKVARTLVQECVRILRPNGWLYSELVDAETNVRGKPGAGHGEWQNTEIHGRLRNRFLRTTRQSEIKSLFEGLRIDKVERISLSTVYPLHESGEKFVANVVLATKPTRLAPPD